MLKRGSTHHRGVVGAQRKGRRDDGNPFSIRDALECAAERLVGGDTANGYERGGR